MKTCVHEMAVLVLCWCNAGCNVRRGAPQRETSVNMGGQLWVISGVKVMLKAYIKCSLLPCV